MFKGKFHSKIWAIKITFEKNSSRASRIFSHIETKTDEKEKAYDSQRRNQGEAMGG